MVKLLQMGSRMKKSIFDEQTSKALKKYHSFVLVLYLEVLTKIYPPQILNSSSCATKETNMSLK
jgi:hypothetical protein